MEEPLYVAEESESDESIVELEEEEEEIVDEFPGITFASFGSLLLQRISYSNWHFCMLITLHYLTLKLFVVT